MPPASDAPGAATAATSRRLMVVVRLVITPLLVCVALTADRTQPLLWAFVALRCAWLVPTVVALLRDRPPRFGPRIVPFVDIALTAGMVATTGAERSPLIVVAVMLPCAAGFLFEPGQAVLVAAATALAVLGPAAPALVDPGPGDLGHVAVAAALLAFATTVGATVARARSALVARTAEADAARRRLLGGALSAEDRERRSVSRALHGEALQLLLAARQDLDEPAEVLGEGLARARDAVRDSVALLRETVRDLHPAALRHLGLEAALRAALEHRVRGRVSINAAPGASGAREQVVLSVVRELGDALAATEHDAEVDARVARVDDDVVLVLQARGDATDAAWSPQHLEATRERVEAHGGTVTAGAHDGGRAAVEVRLPVVRRPPRRADVFLDAAPADENPEVHRNAGRLLAVLRLLAVPTILALGTARGQAGPTFLVLVGLGLAWHAVAVVLAFSRRRPRFDVALSAVGDLAAIAPLIAASGGANSDLRLLLPVLPFVLVVYFRPRGALALSLVLGLALVAGSSADLTAMGAERWRHLVVAELALAVASVLSLLLALGRQRMRRRLAMLEEDRRRMLRDSIGAADAERRRLSQRLHDEALQVLMIAGQDLDEALAGDAGAADRARLALADGMLLLRDAVADLHPPALDHGGLSPATSALLERGAERGGFTTSADVGPRTDGLHDELVLALVRELVENVVRHADAGHVEVRIAREHDALSVEVADDGRGIAAGRASAAVAEGHIGLASARERVAAADGAMALETTVGGGTRVRIVLPVVGAADAAAHPREPV